MASQAIAFDQQQDSSHGERDTAVTRKTEYDIAVEEHGDGFLVSVEVTTFTGRQESLQLAGGGEEQRITIDEETATRFHEIPAIEERLPASVGLTVEATVPRPDDSEVEVDLSAMESELFHPVETTTEPRTEVERGTWERWFERALTRAPRRDDTGAPEGDMRQRYDAGGRAATAYEPAVRDQAPVYRPEPLRATPVPVYGVLPEPAGTLHAPATTGPAVEEQRAGATGRETYATVDIRFPSDDVIIEDYDADTADGLSQRVILQQPDELAQSDSTTALDVVETLAEQGQVDVTVVEQPYRLGDEWVSVVQVGQVEGMDLDFVEAYAGAPEETEIMQTTLDRYDVGEDEVVELRESYNHGHVGGQGPSDEEMASIRAAWDDEYRWFDDWEDRSAYALLADARQNDRNVVRAGTPFDVSRTPEARSAYIDTFGVAPEDDLADVVYGQATSDISPATGQAAV
ncbi:MAG: hypothetical protein SVW77_04085 [Candidatus Nanohaloarchaea archaeon]|nr:hypothetical protein [Candidatus Nanohaloarchaea archaeon]